VEGKFAHEPAAEGECLSCHEAHHSPNQALLTAAVPDQCLACHDGDDPAFKALHLGLSGSQIDCRKCHDAHGAEAPRLMQANQHDPFAGNACGLCHSSVADAEEAQ
jgi:predicted CXXCH cytochrome family protein